MVAEIEPMQGRRVRAIRCGAQGHGQCEVTDFAEPATRTQEKNAWRSDASNEAPNGGAGISSWPNEQEMAERCGCDHMLGQHEYGIEMAPCEHCACDDFHDPSACSYRWAATAGRGCPNDTGPSNHDNRSR